MKAAAAPQKSGPGLPTRPGLQAPPEMEKRMKTGFTNYGAPSVEGMEPNWTKQISSNTVCDWFYIFFIFNAVFVALLIFSLFSNMKGSTRVRLFQILPAAIIGAVNILFWYLMCDRSLLQ
jgi:ABC-type sugar transport system permease subunit